jgi:hypothetical protein
LASQGSLKQIHMPRMPGSESGAPRTSGGGQSMQAPRIPSPRAPGRDSGIAPMGPPKGWEGESQLCASQRGENPHDRNPGSASAGPPRGGGCYHILSGGCPDDYKGDIPPSSVCHSPPPPRNQWLRVRVRSSTLPCPRSSPVPGSRGGGVRAAPSPRTRALEDAGSITTPQLRLWKQEQCSSPHRAKVHASFLGPERCRARVVLSRLGTRTLEDAGIP